MAYALKIKCPWRAPLFSEVREWLKQNGITDWCQIENTQEYFIIQFKNEGDAVHFKLGFEPSNNLKKYYRGAFILDATLVDDSMISKYRD